MKALFHFAAEIQAICIEQSWRFCFIGGILLRQRNKLDWKHIETNLAPLLEIKESPHILTKLKELKSNFSD